LGHPEASGYCSQSERLLFGRDTRNLRRCLRRFVGRNRKSRRREAAGRRNYPEAVPNGEGGNGSTAPKRVQNYVNEDRRHKLIVRRVTFTSSGRKGFDLMVGELDEIYREAIACAANQKGNLLRIALRLAWLKRRMQVQVLDL
jgi:hypothetical protein